jgi:signal transduction histidine kinase/DNA-binding response OmpR family regulator
MRSSKENILIVEPSEALGQKIKECLVAEGYMVSIVFNGNDAKEKIHFTNYSLILLSYNLPDVDDTLEFLVHIKELYPETLVIVIADQVSKEMTIEATRKGAYDFLEKGCSLEEIKIVVKKSLDRRSLGIKNKQLFSEIQKKNKELEWRVKELSALYKISKTIASQPTLEEALKGLFQSIRHLIHLDYFICLSFDQETKEFHLRFAQGIGDDTIKHLSFTNVKIELAPSDQLNKEDLILHYTECLKKFLQTKGFYKLLLDSFLAVPIIIKDDLYGLFIVASHQKNIFSSEQRQLLSIIASQALSLYEKSLRLTKSTQLITMGEMISEIAHDLRHPITTIKGAIQNLENKWYDDAFREKSLGIVNNSIFRLNELVKELLSFSNPERFPLKTVDINQTIKKVLELTQNDLLRQRINLVQEIGVLPPVQVNEERIKEAFLNLIMNAIDSMEKGGKIKISTRLIQKKSNEESKSFVQIDFSDTGSGIDPNIRKKIFDHFFSTKESGTGLGLAVVNRVIKAHDGFIELKSEPGKGSTFSLHLPISKEC